MTNLLKTIAVIVSATLAATIVVQPVEAQSRRAVGAAVGVAAGLGILGVILSQQRVRAQPVQRRIPREVKRRAPSSPAPDMSAVQRALTAHGYDVGTPNGKSGPKTRSAISAYQRDNGIAVTGKLTPQQIGILLGAGGGVAVGTIGAGRPAVAAGTEAESATQQGIPQSPLLVADKGEFAGGPRELPVGPNDPAWASGTWTGSTKCWQRIYDIKMTVPVAVEGAKARLEYRWREDLGRRRPSGQPMSGTGAVELNVAQRELTAMTVLSGDEDHPFKRLALREGNENLPVFRSAPCSGGLPLVRALETVPKRKLTRSTGLTAAAGDIGHATQAGSSKSLFGEWDGELKCARGATRPLYIKLGTVSEIAQAGSQRVDQNLMAANRPGRIAASITQVVSSNAGGESIWTRLIGEYSEDDRAYRFAAVSGNGNETPLRNLVLRQTEAGLEGSIAGEPCTELKATRPDRLASSDMPSVSPPGNGGTFYAARDIGIRCDALIKWGDRTAREVPEKDQYSANANVASLFTDSEFIPVFGRSIDAARNTTVGADIYNAIHECARDPLTKPKLGFLQRHVSNRIASQNGFDWSRITFFQKHVQEARLALNRLNLARLEAERVSDASQAVIHLAEAQTRFESAPTVMLASQKAEINASMKQILSVKAERVFEGSEQAVMGQPAWAKLDSLRSMRLFSTPVTRHMDEKARQRALVRMEEPERQAATEVFDPLFAKAKAMSVSANGLREMDTLDAGKLFAILSPKVREPLQTAWNANRDATLNEAVEQELTRAVDAPRNQAGLQLGAVWLTDFKENWTGFHQVEVVRNALNRFYGDRKARLRDALPEFQAAIRTAAEGERQALRERYLSLPEDRRNPVSLEYELVAEGV